MRKPLLKSLLAMTTVALVALTASIGSTASAAAPAAVSIRGTVTRFGSPPAFRGVWESSGAFSDTGSFVETELHPTGSLLHSPVVGVFQALILFSGSRGTFTVAQQAVFTPDARGGRWEVVSGTGAFEGLTGHGIFQFELPNSLAFTGLTTGAS